MQKTHPIIQTFQFEGLDREISAGVHVYVEFSKRANCLLILYECIGFSESDMQLINEFIFNITVARYSLYNSKNIIFKYTNMCIQCFSYYRFVA